MAEKNAPHETWYRQLELDIQRLVQNSAQLRNLASGEIVSLSEFLQLEDEQENQEITQLYTTAMQHKVHIPPVQQIALQRAIGNKTSVGYRVHPDIAFPTLCATNAVLTAFELFKCPETAELHKFFETIPNNVALELTRKKKQRRPNLCMWHANVRSGVSCNTLRSKTLTVLSALKRALTQRAAPLYCHIQRHTNRQKILTQVRFLSFRSRTYSRVHSKWLCCGGLLVLFSITRQTLTTWKPPG